MRPEKATIVSDLSERLSRTPFVLVTDYQHMKVDQFGELRNRLAPAGAEIRVVKNSFLKRAMADSGLPDVGDQLTGQTAIVMGEKDVAPIAKILKTFAAEFKIAAVKIGVVDKSILSTAEVSALAELPSREVLLSQLLGLLLMPATQLVRVLNEPASALARLLKAKETKDRAGQADAKEQPAAPEAPAAQAEPPAEKIPEPAAAAETAPADAQTVASEAAMKPEEPLRAGGSTEPEAKNEAPAENAPESAPAAEEPKKEEPPAPKAFGAEAKQEAAPGASTEEPTTTT